MKEYYISSEQAKNIEEMAKAHNESIDRFINITLREHFGSDTINAEQWFEAQRLINQQNFYDKGHTILVVLRTLGIDCKMDMQSNKLVCPELGI
jgi:hypothetical protein